MIRQTAPRRKPKYRSPDQQRREQDERRVEIMKQASVQAITIGCEELVMLEALLMKEATIRANGDPERALFILDMEREMIQQDQSRDAIEAIIAIVKEAADEHVTDPTT